MYNYYFTYWMARYSRKEFEMLIKKVGRKVTVPLKLKEGEDTDDFLFHYFYMVYCIVALNYLGLNVKQISLILDILIMPGICKLYPPADILKQQRDAIPDIERYIEKDLELY